MFDIAPADRQVLRSALRLESKDFENAEHGETFIRSANDYCGRSHIISRIDG